MKHFVASIRMLVFMTIVTGIIYPLIVTGIGQTLLRDRANGGIVKRSGVVIGASLLAQKFEGEKFFWSRPSGVDYNSSSSGASNLGQASADLKKAYDDRMAKLKAAHPDQSTEPPQDLLFASGSGLDPHISPQAAEYQLNRVAKARQMETNAVRSLIAETTEGRQFGILGEPRVNVFQLNLALDRAQGVTAAPTPAPTPVPTPTPAPGPESTSSAQTGASPVGDTKAK